MERLQKVLAQAGVASRRRSEDIDPFRKSESQRTTGHRTGYQGESPAKTGSRWMTVRSCWREKERFCFINRSK